MARRLASEGVNVAIIARREPALVALAEEISDEFGVEAVPIPADPAQPETPEEAIGGATKALGALNAALLHLTKSVGELVGPDGIRVMAVNPGLTTTERMLEAIHVWATTAGQTDSEYLDTYLRETVPLGRLTKPEEVATAIAYLCSSAAMATGSALQLDGGAAKGVF